MTLIGLLAQSLADQLVAILYYLETHLGSPRNKQLFLFLQLRLSIDRWDDCVELAWLTRLFHELQVSYITPIPLKCNNEESIHIAHIPFFHERTKHIKIDCHYVREKLQNGLITLSYVSTQDQYADVFTKSLNVSQHSYAISNLGLQPLPSSLRGVLVLST